MKQTKDARRCSLGARLDGGLEVLEMICPYAVGLACCLFGPFAWDVGVAGVAQSLKAATGFASDFALIALCICLFLVPSKANLERELDATREKLQACQRELNQAQRKQVVLKLNIIYDE